jgi:rSAM/selenodomain-associated transferase 1
MKKAIIVFQKAAVLGKVKTRLAKRVGNTQALKVYQYLVAYTHRQLEEIEAEIFVYFSGEPDTRFSTNSNYHIRRQCKGDLGLRMATAFGEVFDAGYDQVLVIGTDCNELKSNILVEAFQGLKDADLVIGAAKDGGYYLLGLCKATPELFDGIKWSTASVFGDTMEIAASLGHSVYLLPVLNDVDRYEDLGELGALLGIEPLGEH